ncbi:LacI family DNA-binding transcriptional regulator [Anaerobium acetethylicum]|uniref:LacI family transcriptional regulator n=1 Tax=Anaerobium acetethylicum TaxID=1619234 RepID=A0A1D3TX02_9FIRM|nr:LacI family DNA-binding transcriptional regulator [Anaerobium acetethylicum]SCP98816.1 LacI family transcriptional regulator [Anaerobium acetethylicum]
MITIKEIADELGISTTTVNNVIHGKTKEVSKATIEKVEKMIAKYEYVPNMNARNLAQNRSKIIAVAMKARKDKYENAIKDSYVGELIGAIEKSVRTSEYFLMIYISDDIGEILKNVSTWNVDGLILLGMSGDDSVMIKKKFKKPMVFVDSYFCQDVMGYYNVGLEDAKGTYEATKYLLECGHRKIAFLADNCVGVDHERFIGYKRALQEYGIGCREEDFFVMMPAENEIEACLDELYHYSEQYTALCCASDYYAVMVMNYLSDRGKIIPDDISVVGFDDNASATIVRPALTTIHQDVTKKGEVAVEKLLKMVNGEELEEENMILPVKLVVRDSVKKMNQ